jgi:flagellar biosynthesis/type III secretory pathway protein FliH
VDTEALADKLMKFAIEMRDVSAYENLADSMHLRYMSEDLAGEITDEFQGAYDNGYQAGYDEGRDDGHEIGYEQGYSDTLSKVLDAVENITT